jgi:aspartyl-tRNA(Asn)/glutamyl-tRNA(Gln) amidotransferase subunit C
MPDEITPDIFAHMVGLAALELDQDEAEYLRRQLNNQLKAIHELEAIPIDPVTRLTSHGVAYTPGIIPPIRQDEWLPFKDNQDIISQAPETQDGYIVVPEVKHTELE